MEGTHLRTLIPRADKPIDLIEELKRSEARHPDCHVRVHCVTGGVTWELSYDAKKSGDTLKVFLASLEFTSAIIGAQIRVDTGDPPLVLPRYITPNTRLVLGGSTVQKVILTHEPESFCDTYVPPGNRCSLC